MKSAEVQLVGALSLRSRDLRPNRPSGGCEECLAGPAVLPPPCDPRHGSLCRIPDALEEEAMNTESPPEPKGVAARLHW